ncbi:MAG: hypothetical protein KF900_10130 [Bacteroidetes bacterium]|nr:hypothetical protein [Bacteroidota bacterium]
MMSFRLNEFVNANSFEQLAALYETIDEKRLHISDTGISESLINRWKIKGLLNFGKETKNQKLILMLPIKQKISFIEFVWIKIANELQTFGITLETINKMAKDLFGKISDNELYKNLITNFKTGDSVQTQENEKLMLFLKLKEESENAFHFLHVLTAQAVVTQEPILMMVFNNETWFPYLEQNNAQYPEDLMRKKQTLPYVSINLTNIVYTYIYQDYLQEMFSGMSMFTAEEANLLYYIAEGNFKKIHVSFKTTTQKPKEIPKAENTFREVIHLFLNQQYRYCTLTDNKGREIKITTKDELAIKLFEDKCKEVKQYKRLLLNHTQNLEANQTETATEKQNKKEETQEQEAK